MPQVNQNAENSSGTNTYKIATNTFPNASINNLGEHDQSEAMAAGRTGSNQSKKRVSSASRRKDQGGDPMNTFEVKNLY